MRENKFRAWDKIIRKMLSWEEIKSNLILETIFVETKQFIPLQYTGLKDKNGKEIYEGDILGVKTRKRNKKYQFTHVVEWKELELYGGQWTGDGFDFPPWDLFIEVIGNIYENPELLEEK